MRIAVKTFLIVQGVTHNACVVTAKPNLFEDAKIVDKTFRIVQRVTHNVCLVTAKTNLFEDVRIADKTFRIVRRTTACAYHAFVANGAVTISGTRDKHMLAYTKDQIL